MAAMILVFAPLSGRLVGRRGARGRRWLAAPRAARRRADADPLSPTHPVRATCSAPTSLFGIGIGLINPPITNTAVSGMPAAQAGVASAVASTSRQVGMTLGVAVIGAIAGGGVAARSARASPPDPPRLVDIVGLGRR